ncbi:unnamed protein product [Calypogeia fissa]
MAAGNGNKPPGGAPSWEALLKWSIANTDGLQQAPAREISEEDRKWFNEALQAHTIDVIRRMKEISLVLNTPQQILDEQGVTPEEQEGMLEELQEHVESIDMANDLHAIGGLIPLLNYLKNPHAPIRARAAEVVMTMVQNNEKCQKQVMDEKGLQLLLHNFTSDEDVNVRAKALGAISSLIRHNKDGVAAFRLGNGYAGLRDALSTGHSRLQRKALQVLLYLLQENPKDAKVVSDLGLTRVLISLLSSQDADIRQAALSCLVETSKNVGLEAAAETRGQLKQLLSQRIEEIKQLGPDDQAAAKEECYLIDSLWKLAFNEPSPLRQTDLLVPPATNEEEGVEAAISADRSSENSSQRVEKSEKPPLMLLGPG